MRLKAFHLVRNHSCIFSRGMSILLLLFELSYFTELLLYFFHLNANYLPDAVYTYFFQCTAWPFVFIMGIFWRKSFQYLWSSIYGSCFCLLAKKSKPNARFSRPFFFCHFFQKIIVLALPCRSTIVQILFAEHINFSLIEGIIAKSRWLQVYFFVCLFLRKGFFV